MNAFSPSQYKYIPGQIVYCLNIPGDLVTASANCTVTLSAGETAGLALATNKALSSVPFSQADVEMSFGVLPSTTIKISSSITDSTSYDNVSVNYVGVYGNENLNSGQVLLSSKFKATVTRV